MILGKRRPPGHLSPSQGPRGDLRARCDRSGRRPRLWGTGSARGRHPETGRGQDGTWRGNEAGAGSRSLNPQALSRRKTFPPLYLQLKDLARAWKRRSARAACGAGPAAAAGLALSPGARKVPESVPGERCGARGWGPGALGWFHANPFWASLGFPAAVGKGASGQPRRAGPSRPRLHSGVSSCSSACGGAWHEGGRDASFSRAGRRRARGRWNERRLCTRRAAAERACALGSPRPRPRLALLRLCGLGRGALGVLRGRGRGRGRDGARGARPL
uniref:uncharacterized protein LOC114679012 n=1 Tax=Macaca mulatta TaxID=9544 RepID=UPI0010A26489|nr:uncharacterized protein LOC114679012 [Macaca mulatta]